jgi:methionyl-tRNA formyltransferase
MKYVFFGSPRFAAIILERLVHGGMAPVAVVCNPDRPVGRKKIITPPPTKEIALREKITVLQPEILDGSFAEELKKLHPDFFVVAAYAKIIPGTILTIPRLGTLGTHPSLLPKYRGPSPIQSVILADETETGTTIYQMDAKMDRGPIFDSASFPLESLVTKHLILEEQLAEVSATLLIELIPNFLNGTLTPRVQDETQATYTKKFKTEDGFVDEKNLAAAERGDTEQSERIVRTINAFTPEPGCWTMRDGKRVKLLEAEIKTGALKLLVTQEEGQKPIRR